VVVSIARREHHDENGDRDSGIGIRPDLLPHLFEAFKGGAAGSRGNGLGLGLYITQQIVQAHGGAVSATSGHGTTVLSVRLPRRAALAHSLAART
jgi:signal transduction histidine kinase